jgi:hypothetical protein
MNFDLVIRQVVGDLDAAQVRYAVIGGFAMAMRGLQRATVDLDFILLLEDMGKAHEIITRHGYRRVYHSENVSHYECEDQAWGRIDILHAFRGPSLGMLERADRLPVFSDLSLPVVKIEDLIGLKVQASVNNPSRIARDWSDIRMILEVAGENKDPVDWVLVEDYLEIFHLQEKLPQLKAYHGQA